MKKRYLGIAATVHDPAIAIIDENGVLLFAEALERSMQCKIAWDISPIGMFTYLENTLSRFHSDDVIWSVGLSWNYDAKRQIINTDEGSTTIDISVAPNKAAIPDPQWGRWLLELQTQYLNRLDKILPFTISSITGQPNIAIEHFDHHLTHAANASYFYAGAQPALVVIADGEGEVGSLSCFKLAGGKLERIGRSWGPGSLGGFYGTITNLIGFDLRKGEEWKVMGLSAYGQFDQEIYQDLEPLVNLHKGTILAPDDEYREFVISKYSRLRQHLKDNVMLAANIAFAAQRIFEEKMLLLLKYYQNKSGLKHLVLGGGCALNSRFNGLLSELGIFESVFVPPAPGDDGNAVGVAALLFEQDNVGHSCLVKPQFTSPYLGNEVDTVVLQRAVEQYEKVEKCPNHAMLCQVIAKELANGKLVGWVQGRAEFGPRALGNRSILANPSIPDIKNIINRRVKFRESYRPFAPAILDEHGTDWFAQYQYWPYMGAAITFATGKGIEVEGVVHEDGTGRVQSVSEETNPLFYNLISAFYKETGIPILLNTSLNVMGKPIVHSVEDALATFVTSGLDILVINDCIFRK
ncbi:carbamoyltransferase family protein [Rheinheimera maricola]|uniref:Carbamoyltransferase n=1 Tax=Rheinheimera maricola TaxID=2793282 RepID=A0ABS7X4X3_9GAMM|nr:carbamoyltransferase C-terminal domain-containing protein [Rheinheimera maricola]MBZ9610341.1 hypothetical protein [Rheinheimera maricola]